MDLVDSPWNPGGQGWILFTRPNPMVQVEGWSSLTWNLVETRFIVGRTELNPLVCFNRTSQSRPWREHEILGCRTWRRCLEACVSKLEMAAGAWKYLQVHVVLRRKDIGPKWRVGARVVSKHAETTQIHRSRVNKPILVVVLPKRGKMAVHDDSIDRVAAPSMACSYGSFTTRSLDFFRI